ncbi:MAG: ABC transporter permease [Dokdonella sp.]
MITPSLNDIRHALRGLLARPGFTITAVVTLALGIGTNAVIFSVIDALLWHPLSYPNADRIVSIDHTYTKTGEGGGSTVPDYLDQRAQASSLADVAIYQYATFNLIATAAAPLRLVGMRATPSLFPTLGVQPLMGRALIDDDATEGRDHVVVVSYDAWQNQFSGDPAIIGRDVSLSGDTYRVVGVMPKEFFFPDRDVQLWTPYTIKPEEREDAERGYSGVQAIGRLQLGVSVEELESELHTITARNAARSSKLREDYATTGFVINAQPLKKAWFGGLQEPLWLLQGFVGLVLLIAMANVMNLVLVRFSARRRDFALRAALGASRVRLDRQVVTETSVLALLGGAGGLLLAAAAIPLLSRIGFAETLRWSAVDPGISSTLIAYVLALSIAMGLLIGTITAWSLRQARGFDLLRASGQTGSAGRAANRVRNTLVVGQFALTLMLLVGAGLLLKSFQRLMNTDPGFDSEKLLTARLDLPDTGYADDAARSDYYERLLAETRSLPGVEMAAYTGSLPFDGHTGTSEYTAEGYAGTDAGALVAQRQSVSEDYFSTLGIALLEGRAFSAGDTQTSAPVVIVDETLAQHLWPNHNALGQRLKLEQDDPWMTVVGVARAVKQNDLSETGKRDAMYWPVRQHARARGELVVKSSLPPSALIPQLRSAALRVDAALPIYDIQTMDERIAHSLDWRRAPTMLLGAFAGLALLLAAIGIYGLLAFTMGQRTSELGVRMAVGAKARDVQRLVISDGMRLCLVGIGVGLLGALAIGQLMRAQLFEVGAIDPLVFTAVTGLLTITALLACWLPARRASRINPVVALRHE